MKTMKRKVLHRSRVIIFRNYTRTTTMCGRMRTVSDGMNIAETDKEVTCKFCLKLVKTV